MPVFGGTRVAPHRSAGLAVELFMVSAHDGLAGDEPADIGGVHRGGDRQRGRVATGELVEDHV